MAGQSVKINPERNNLVVKDNKFLPLHWPMKSTALIY
jgi:hypothetical protein